MKKEVLIVIKTSLLLALEISESKRVLQASMPLKNSIKNFCTTLPLVTFLTKSFNLLATCLKIVLDCLTKPLPKWYAQLHSRGFLLFIKPLLCTYSKMGKLNKLSLDFYFIT